MGLDLLYGSWASMGVGYMDGCGLHAYMYGSGLRVWHVGCCKTVNQEVV